MSFNSALLLARATGNFGLVAGAMGEEEPTTKKVRFQLPLGSSDCINNADCEGYPKVVCRQDGQRCSFGYGKKPRCTTLAKGTLGQPCVYGSCKKGLTCNKYTGNCYDPCNACPPGFKGGEGDVNMGGVCNNNKDCNDYPNVICRQTGQRCSYGYGKQARCTPMEAGKLGQPCVAGTCEPGLACGNETGICYNPSCNSSCGDDIVSVMSEDGDRKTPTPAGKAQVAAATSDQRVAAAVLGSSEKIKIKTADEVLTERKMYTPETKMEETADPDVAVAKEYEGNIPTIKPEDPDVKDVRERKAAVKIQALQRGRQARQARKNKAKMEKIKKITKAAKQIAPLLAEKVNIKARLAAYCKSGATIPKDKTVETIDKWAELGLSVEQMKEAEEKAKAMATDTTNTWSLTAMALAVFKEMGSWTDAYMGLEGGEDRKTAIFVSWAGELKGCNKLQGTLNSVKGNDLNSIIDELNEMVEKTDNQTQIDQDAKETADDLAIIVKNETITSDIVKSVATGDNDKAVEQLNKVQAPKGFGWKKAAVTVAALGFGTLASMSTGEFQNQLLESKQLVAVPQVTVTGDVFDMSFQGNPDQLTFEKASSESPIDLGDLDTAILQDNVQIKGDFSSERLEDIRNARFLDLSNDQFQQLKVVQKLYQNGKMTKGDMGKMIDGMKSWIPFANNNDKLDNAKALVMQQESLYPANQVMENQDQGVQDYVKIVKDIQQDLQEKAQEQAKIDYANKEFFESVLQPAETLQQQLEDLRNNTPTLEQVEQSTKDVKSQVAQLNSAYEKREPIDDNTKAFENQLGNTRKDLKEKLMEIYSKYIASVGENMKKLIEIRENFKNITSVLQEYDNLDEDIQEVQDQIQTFIDDIENEDFDDAVSVASSDQSETDVEIFGERIKDPKANEENRRLDKEEVDPQLSQVVDMSFGLQGRA